MNKKELVQLLIENFTDEKGNLVISGLDFSDFNGDVNIGKMKVKRNLCQNFQEVDGFLVQDYQNVGESLHQGSQQVKRNVIQSYLTVGESLHQDFQKVGGNLHQDNQQVGGILMQARQLAKTYHLQDRENLVENINPIGLSYFTNKDNVEYIKFGEGLSAAIKAFREKDKANE